MVKPRDESARARFASELGRNFSVVASAGSGKTTAITQRVLSIARSPNAADTMPHLVVVTFTNRAADEMQQRTRQALLQENLRQEVQTAFNRAFFGTIHSFCMKLLIDFGHYLGLPAPLELVEDDDDLWQEFVQNQTRIGRSLSDKDRAMLMRFVQARHMMDLRRRAEDPRRKLSCHSRRGAGHRAAAIFRATGSDASAGSERPLVARTASGSAARPLLYGRRFPAIDLLAAGGPELLQSRP